MSKKNILVICPHLPHLDPRIDWIAEEFEKKYEVNVLGSFPEGTDSTVNQELFYKSHTTRLIPMIEPSRIFSNFTSLFYNLKIVLNISIYYLQGFANKNVKKRIYRGFTKSGFILFYFLYFYRTYKALMQGMKSFPYSFDAIYCNDLGGLLASVIFRRKNKSLLIYDAHEIYWDSVNGSPRSFKILVRWYEDILMRFVDIFITVSPPILELYLKRYPYLKGRALCVPNAAKYDNYLNNDKNNNKNQHKKDQVIFLYQGVIDRQRGIEEILQAWIEEDPKGGQLVIRGPMPTYMREIIHNMAAPLLDRSIFLSEPVKHDDLISEACFADVGIIPYPSHISLNQRYCSPNKFGQYMQAGLAILSSNTDFISTKIHEYKNGLIYDARNIEEIKTAIRSLISDKELLTGYQKASLHHARHSYNWQIVAKDMVALIDKNLTLLANSSKNIKNS